MDIRVNFDTWRRAVDLYLDRLGYPPLCLADLPAGFEAALQTWFDHRVRAYVVARCMVAVIG